MGYKKMLQERKAHQAAQAAQKESADTEIITADTRNVLPPYIFSYPQTEFEALFEGFEDF